jgi:hypothetical protein
MSQAKLCIGMAVTVPIASFVKDYPNALKSFEEILRKHGYAILGEVLGVQTKQGGKIAVKFKTWRNNIPVDLVEKLDYSQTIRITTILNTIFRLNDVLLVARDDVTVF